MEGAITALGDLLDAENVRLSDTLADLADVTNRLQDLVPERIPHRYENIDRAVEAIGRQIDETEAIEVLDATQSLLQDLNWHIETTLQRGRTGTIGQAIESWRQGQASYEPHQYNTDRAAGLVQEWHDERDVAALIPELRSIVESLSDRALTNPPQYEMERTVELVQEWHIEQGIEALLPKLQSIVQTLSAQTPHRYNLERVAEVVQEWQDERDVSNLLSEIQDVVESLSPLKTSHGYSNLDHAVASFTEQADHELLQESDLIEQLRSLVDHLNTRYPKLERSPHQPHQYRNMDKAVALVAETRAEATINRYLDVFYEVAAQWREGFRQQLDLQRLADSVSAFRASLTEASDAINDRARRVAEELDKLELSTTPTPQKLQPFWEPQYPAPPPDHIQPRHWEEFKRSCIHPDLIAANAESIEGMEVYERLLSERLSTMGSGQFVTASMAREMAKYAQVAEGGWWGKAGTDAQSLNYIQPGQRPFKSNWGCFKPDNPRIDAEKSERKEHPVPIKYEHPARAPRRIYLPIVPDSLAERMYEKYGIQPTAAEKASGFWYVAKQYNMPITITEGIKKTWASLSQGEVTIGVSGVNGLYRSNDNFGNRLSERQLNDHVAVFTEAAKELNTFATPGREFRFAYDKDDNPNTIRNVRRDLVRGIELLQERGCTCKIVEWEGDKGLDDLILNQGPTAYAKAQDRAVPAEQEVRQYYRYQYQTIANQVRMAEPLISNERLDCEVYLKAVEKGDSRDGARFVGESDEARSRRNDSPQAGEQYVRAVARVAQMYEGVKRQRRKDIDEIICRAVIQQSIAQHSHSALGLQQQKGFSL